jgi:hypothetical protein
MLPPDPELIAEALLAAHPHAEPFEVPGEDLLAWLEGVGAPGDDDALVAAALAAWEIRRT